MCLKALQEKYPTEPLLKSRVVPVTVEVTEICDEEMTEEEERVKRAVEELEKKLREYERRKCSELRDLQR